MRIDLHSLILAPAMLAAATFAVHPAAAWAARPGSAVHIPFEFEVAGQTYPAGEYKVRPGSLGNTVALESYLHTFVWIAGPGDANPADQRTILTFDVLGSRHLLRSVQYHAMSTNQLDKKALKQMKEDIRPQEQSVAGQ
ncbi:MAG TPA: hypothetical protein VKU93_05650 [Terracidiphilus sp.]|nr:hypothetical protein [Terracidiphilus sp.]